MNGKRYFVLLATDPDRKDIEQVLAVFEDPKRVADLTLEVFGNFDACGDERARTRSELGRWLERGAKGTLSIEMDAVGEVLRIESSP